VQGFVPDIHGSSFPVGSTAAWNLSNASLSVSKLRALSSCAAQLEITRKTKHARSKSPARPLLSIDASSNSPTPADLIPVVAVNHELRVILAPAHSLSSASSSSSPCSQRILLLCKTYAPFSSFEKPVRSNGDLHLGCLLAPFSCEHPQDFLSDIL
jgi:hypothetical protein